MKIPHDYRRRADTRHDALIADILSLVGWVAVLGYLAISIIGG